VKNLIKLIAILFSVGLAITLATLILQETSAKKTGVNCDPDYAVCKDGDTLVDTGEYEEDK
jgi:hypothetical protein